MMPTGYRFRGLPSPTSKGETRPSLAFCSNFDDCAKYSVQRVLFMLRHRFLGAILTVYEKSSVRGSPDCQFIDLPAPLPCM